MKLQDINPQDIKPGDSWLRPNNRRVEVGAITQIGQEWSFRVCLLLPGETYSEFHARSRSLKKLLKLIGPGVKIIKA